MTFTVERATYPIALTTERLLLRQVVPEDAGRVGTYFDENEAHLAAWVATPPPRPEAAWKQALAAISADWQSGAADRELRLQAYLRDAPSETQIGQVSFTRFRERFDLSCGFAFALDHRHLGQGYATEAGRAGIQFVLEHLSRHRIEAEYRTDNLASGRVLERLGFHRIGVSPAHRWASGAWRDHVLVSLVNPAPMEPSGLRR